MDAQYHRIKQEIKEELIWKDLLCYQVCYMFFATLTAPLTTLGISLQLSSGKLEKFYNDPGTEVSKLELAKSHDLKVKERLFNEVQLASGLPGSNRPFRAPYYKNYREVISALTAQGYKGFFKGNFLDVTYHLTTTYPLIVAMHSERFRETPRNIRPVGLLLVQTIAELVSQPCHNMQSRFILQNRIPEFALYRSVYHCVKSTHGRGMYQGVNVVVPKRLLSFFLLYRYDYTFYHPLNIFICYLFVYPLETVQRRLEVQSSEHSLLPRRYLDNIRYTLSRIYNEEGITKGLYRGFIMNYLSLSLKIPCYFILSNFVIDQSNTYSYVKENLID